jgi:hypothetical protein
MATVTLALLVLQPLLYFHLYIPATLYLSVILLLHAVFLYVYVIHMPWQQVLAQKKILIGRVGGILLIAYALGLIKTTTNLGLIFVNILAMAVLHGVILALIMTTDIKLVRNS